MNANVIEVKPFNITKIELVALRGPKGDTGYPSPEEIQTAVDAWLEDHPEATTTVQDGAITTVKLADNAVTEDKLSESLQSLLITDTASGSIASFSDGSDGIPIKGLEVNIEPKQDLHGYANPWPAGGGKNIVNEDSILQGGWDGTASTNNCYTDGYIPITPSTAYTWSQTGSTNGRYARFFDSSKTFIDGASITQYNTTVATFTSPSNAYYMQLQWYSSSAITPTDIKALKPMIEKGSTATAYAPYSNICPITGWTEAKVTRTGVNVWDEEWELGGIDHTTGANNTVNTVGRSKNYIPVISGKTYYINAPCFMHYYDKDKVYLSYVTITPSGTFTVPSGACYARFNVTTAYGATYNHDISINYPSTDHTYHASHITTITIPLGSTVYGGTLDVTSGVLTVDRAIEVVSGNISLNGTLPYGGAQIKWVPTQAKKYAPNAAHQNEGLLSNIFNSSVALPDGEGFVTGRSTSGNVFFHMPSNVTTLQEATTWFANNQTQIAYLLATPVSVTLSEQQITTLLGENNIWADAGSVTVDYVADTKRYISKMIANALNS